jgi:hypothetical protein
MIEHADSAAAYDRADRLLAEAEAADMRAVREAEALAEDARGAAVSRRLSAAAMSERAYTSLWCRYPSLLR